MNKKGIWNKMTQFPWLALCFPLIIMCIFIVFLSIKQLVTKDENEWVKALLLPEQELAINFVGPSLLHVEGPRFSHVFSDLDYSLHDQEGEIVLEPVWFRLQTSGLSSVTLRVRRFNIEKPGNYRLNILGLRHSVSTDEHFVIISPDKRVRKTLTIIGLVLSAVVMLLSFIFSTIILRLHVFS